MGGSLSSSMSLAIGGTCSVRDDELPIGGAGTQRSCVRRVLVRAGASGTSGNVRPAARAFTSGVMSGAQLRRSASNRFARWEHRVLCKPANRLSLKELTLRVEVHAEPAICIRGVSPQHRSQMGKGWLGRR